jgi:serine/threonine protein kinase
VKDFVEPERWRRVEELYHSALRVGVEQRAAFLQDACQGDTTLCEEVESLLAYESSAKEFMETPAFEMAAKQMAGDEAGENQADPVSIGATLQRFCVIEKLGVGGMGVVYKAEDTRLHRTVALKFLPKKLARDPASLERFEREARAASALNHPNICTIYDLGEYEGQPFIAMELLEGQTLDRRIEGQPLSTEEWLTFGIQITEGLHAAHQKGIIHRDIKPTNIFVTSEGQAKVLDFGLAKLTPNATVIGVDPERDQRDERAQGATQEIEQLRTPDPSLSRTGGAMGTAGYMSPEQARGEKLDARTDLFSLGLVLFEMATGKRAFSGDTGPELHAAILNQIPASARKLNPKLPAKLEEIIRKTLEKEREQRYQSAAELRTDLEVLKRAVLPRALTFRWWAAPAVVVALVLVATVFWYTRRPPASLPDLKLRQLTLNSTENPVTGGLISPDGKYLAYTDKKGLHVKLTETDETQIVPQPEEHNNEGIAWEIVPAGWFPDSARFIANAHPASESEGALSSQTATIWTVSLMNGASHKLRDNGIAWSVSPDGSAIAFGTNKGNLGEREIWLMDPNAEQPRKLFDTDENSSIGGALWSPDGQRVIYDRNDGSGDTFLSRDLKGGPPVTVLTPSESKNINDAVWSPDGRLIYSVRDPQAMGDSCNYWAMRLDIRTGAPIEKPRKLTSWAGFCLNFTTLTKDGKRLSFQESSAYGTTYLADLEEGGTRLVNTRRLSMEEGAQTEDALGAWTADSKKIIVLQNRRDHYGLYVQSLNADTTEPIVTRAEGGQVENSMLSPDGKWFITQIYTVPHIASARAPLMRVPITGGSPELMFTVREGSASACARLPSNLCVVAEATGNNKQMVVTAFDPVTGRGPELARFDLNPDWEDHLSLFDISPEGKHLVLARGTKGPIEIHSVRGQLEQIIHVEGLNNIRALGWSGDGKGLLVTSAFKGGAVVLHVDLKGNAKVLWKCSVGQRCFAGSSPDGRHLAIYDWKLNANMWMMENF